MARVAFLLLCHKNPDAIILQAQQLTAAGDYVAIHFDARAKAGDYAKIKAGLADNANVAFVAKRIKCGWGEWSLVAATLETLATAMAAFAGASHFYMISGDCMPIKSAAFLHQFLDDNDTDYIESFDFFESNWIKTGFREQRLIYRHHFNERTQKRLFYASFALQKRLGLTREIPADLQIMIGSQWWCLRRRTAQAVLDFTRSRRDVVRFFRTTWIPDETYFQTLVRHLVPNSEIACRTLTFLMFTDYGMPLTFYNDHYEMLLGQDAMFARKISDHAKVLKSALGALYASERQDFIISDEGRELFTFLTGRGRYGRRFGPRFWEAQNSIGSGRELLVVTCKKWHVAKRLTAAIRQQTDIAAFDYIFNEEQTDLPDLGGIATSLEKRNRHRRAFLRLLFDHCGQDKLLICLDTSSFDILSDLVDDSARVRVLAVECAFSDEYLTGHAIRVGLAGPQSLPVTFARLLPTIRRDIIHEVDVIRAIAVQNTTRLRQDATTPENTVALAAFLDLALPQALDVAQTPYLFVD
jgi:hypothetical protein